MGKYFLSLFSGIGGFDLAAYWAGLRFDGHYFSEIDKYASAVFQKRFPEAIALGDVRNIEYEKLPKGEWIITGGFPCQDISVAGKGAGLDGDRSGLWFEYARLIGEIRPRFAIMENVGALVVRGLDRVLGSLAEIGYDAEWQDIRASDVGAPHRRERIWIVGYPSGGGCGGIARGRARPEPLDGYSRLETWADRDPNGGYAAKKQEICGGENAKPYGVCANVADSQSGESRKPPQWEGRESIGRGSEKEFMADSDSLRLEYSSQGQNNEGWREIQTQLERIGSDLADSDIINDDNSGHGASPVFGERSPEAEIPGSDPDADRQRFQEFIDRITAWARDPDSPSCRNGIGNFWAVEPNVGRVANGIPSRVGRLKCLGNAVVPQIPELIFMSPAFDLWRE